MHVAIHQIFYADPQRSALDPAFAPYDNRANPRPEWREYDVFRSAWLAGRHRRADATGYLSWKFGMKTGVAGRDFVDFVARHPDHDVWFVHPRGVEPRPFRSIWEQAEVHHPGILGLAQRIFAALGVAVDLARLESAPDRVLFCNYWVGTPRFWEAYMAFCEPVRRQILHGLDEADRRLVWSRADRVIDAPYVPFIMERLVTTLLALRPEIRARGWDGPVRAVVRPPHVPWHRRLLGRRAASA